MKTCLLIFTDGREEYLRKTLQAFQNHVSWLFDDIILIDDSDDPDYRFFLDTEASFALGRAIDIQSNPTRLGFCGTIARAWHELLPDDTDYIFHLEDDFTLQRDIDIGEMISVLKCNQYLTQIALNRQPWGSDPIADGTRWGLLAQYGLVQKEEWFADFNRPLYWAEHQRFCWTSNPSLYPHWVSQCDWRVESLCEATFSGRLLEADPDRRSAYWGKIGEPPLVLHIGEIRKGPWM